MTIEDQEPIVTMAELKRHKQIIRELRAVARAAKDLVTALDNVITCSDDEHPSRYAPLEACEALRLKLKEIGL